MADDFLDNVIEEAASSLSEPASEPTAPSEPVETESAPKEDLVETAEVQKVIERNNTQPKEKLSKKRDSSGKFAKATEGTEPQVAAQPDLDDQVANAEQTQPEAQAQPEAEPGVAPPAFWSAEQKALFTQANRPLQEVIAQRELMFQQHASRLANENKRGKEIEQRFSQVFTEPRQLKLQAEGLKDPLEACERLLAWNELFERDPYTGIADLMRKNGLTANDFAGDHSQPYDNQVIDPRYEDRVRAAEEKAELAQKQFADWKQQQELAVIDQDYQAFRQSKDSYGNSREQFCTAYEPQIADAIRHLREIQPDMTRSQILHHAYEYVLGEARKLHGVQTPTQAPAPSPKAVIAQAQKAKAAAGSVVGAPSNGMAAKGPRLKGKTWDEQFESAFEIASNKHAM